MFYQILKLLTAPQPVSALDDLKVAVAVLLVEAAKMGEHFSQDERALIERLLVETFALSGDDVRQLLSVAESTDERSTQLQPFTHLCATSMDPQQRIHLIEMLWEVGFASGVLDPDEDVLIGRIAGLIYVSSRDRVLARQRVLSRLNQKPKDT
jgi:uncharacterized tellurite resistance protein B-like protein